jgi:hypothetical protein
MVALLRLGVLHSYCLLLLLHLLLLLMLLLLCLLSMCMSGCLLCLLLSVSHCRRLLRIARLLLLVTHLLLR